MLNIITRRPDTAGKLGTAARRVTPYKAATAHPIEVPAEADGIPGTVVRRVTPYRAATAHPIKVQSATRRADGMATELKRPQAQRLSDWQTACRPVCHAGILPAGILPRKFPASDVVPVTLRAIISIVAIATMIIGGIASHRCGSPAWLRRAAKISSASVR